MSVADTRRDRLSIYSTNGHWVSAPGAVMEAGGAAADAIIPAPYRPSLLSSRTFRSEEGSSSVVSVQCGSVGRVGLLSS